ncbi:MAG: exodeoxyribonuclease large subunit [Solirubrobacteraceae bacterium]|nr:exodeoxyribonuclease large subunit [Solirubrobacteraceae bacterium]
MVGPSSSTPSQAAAQPGGAAPERAPLDGSPGATIDDGIPQSRLAGPFGVGDYASALRGKLRSFARVQLVGELVNLRPSRARVYFELRDSDGALPCAAWRDDWERMLARTGQAPAEGMQVVVAGGCDYYPGSATSSPGFSFSVSELRIAGEGDLLARIDRLRKRLDAEGLCELQKRLAMPLVPRSIGVVTGEGGKARDDVLAALARRGWSGRIVWGYAPVQDRHAAPAIVRALGDLAGLARVDVVIVARGGGSLAALLCFCDETLCRTVALLDVPVIASVGHHTDRTLLDDVAAVSCSTPTHAAEAAVGIDLRRARSELVVATRRLHEHSNRAVRAKATLPTAAARLREHGQRAVLTRARLLAALSRAPGAHLDRQRARLHQQLREIRAGSRRRLDDERAVTRRRALVLARKRHATLLDARERRPRELAQLALALGAHDPQRTLERGYAVVESLAGEPLATAREADAVRDVRLRFADGALAAEVKPG